MAIEVVGRVRDNGVTDYVGKSTDIKPVDCTAGSTFWELDTKIAYIFGNGAWWEV